MQDKYILCEKKRKYSYFVIHFEYDPDLVDEVKNIPSADFHAKKKKWYVRVSDESIPHIYMLIKKHNFEATQEILTRIKNTLSRQKYLLELSSAEDEDIDLPDFPESWEPYPFQKAGIKYMLTTKRCFNGDDMGLGKTIQGLMAMEAGNIYPNIVICPASAKKNWLRKAREILPNRKSAILDDLNFSYHHDIMILNYEVVTKYLIKEIEDPDKNIYKVREQIKRIGLKGLTIDESQYCKNPSSKRTQAVKKLSRGVEYRWLLSGTIIENRPKEFISQLQILDRLSDMGGYQNFIKTYCDAKMEWHGNMNKDGASNLELLNKRLRSICMVRRLKEEIKSQIPDKKPPKKIKVPIDSRDDYNLAETNIFEYMGKDYESSRGGTIDLFGGRPSSERNKNEDAIELQIINALRKITGLGKIESSIKWIKKFKKTGKKLVVFAHHRKVQQSIIKEFPECARITGGMDSHEKDRNEMRFQDDPSCWLIVCSIQSANTNHDLFAAHNVLFLELAWTPSTHEQAEDRCHRLGQRKEVQPFYILGKNTIDEDMYELLQEKEKVVNASLDGGKNDEETSILNDLIERMKKKGNINIPDNESTETR